MQYVGRLVSSVYNTIPAMNINAATLSGAIDIIVVERQLEIEVDADDDDNHNDEHDDDYDGHDTDPDRGYSTRLRSAHSPGPGEGASPEGTRTPADAPTAAVKAGTEETDPQPEAEEPLGPPPGWPRGLVWHPPPPPVPAAATLPATALEVPDLLLSPPLRPTDPSSSPVLEPSHPGFGSGFGPSSGPSPSPGPSPSLSPSLAPSLPRDASLGPALDLASGQPSPRPPSSFRSGGKGSSRPAGRNKVRKQVTELASTPFHVRFGKMSVLRPAERRVTLHLNDHPEPLPFVMKVGNEGEAFFVFETEAVDEDQQVIPPEMVTSPVLSAASSPVLSPTDAADWGGVSQEDMTFVPPTDDIYEEDLSLDDSLDTLPSHMSASHEPLPDLNGGQSGDDDTETPRRSPSVEALDLGEPLAPPVWPNDHQEVEQEMDQLDDQLARLALDQTDLPSLHSSKAHHPQPHHDHDFVNDHNSHHEHHKHHRHNHHDQHDHHQRKKNRDRFNRITSEHGEPYTFDMDGYKLTAGGENIAAQEGRRLAHEMRFKANNRHAKAKLGGKGSKSSSGTGFATNSQGDASAPVAVPGSSRERSPEEGEGTEEGGDLDIDALEEGFARDFLNDLVSCAQHLRETHGASQIVHDEHAESNTFPGGGTTHAANSGEEANNVEEAKPEGEISFPGVPALSTSETKGSEDTGRPTDFIGTGNSTPVNPTLSGDKGQIDTELSHAPDDEYTLRLVHRGRVHTFQLSLTGASGVPQNQEEGKQAAAEAAAEGCSAPLPMPSSRPKDSPAGHTYAMSAQDHFLRHRVSYQEFLGDASIASDDRLVVWYQGRYLMWEDHSALLAALSLYCRSIRSVDPHQGLRGRGGKATKTSKQRSEHHDYQQEDDAIGGAPDDDVDGHRRVQPDEPVRAATEPPPDQTGQSKPSRWSRWWSRTAEGNAEPSTDPRHDSEVSWEDDLRRRAEERAKSEPLPGDADEAGTAHPNTSGYAFSSATSDASAPDVAGSLGEEPGLKTNKVYLKTLRLTSDQLKSMNLRKGLNNITFSVTSSFSGVAVVRARIFLWNSSAPVVVSDIDGTITKSDALGHMFTLIGRDWTHQGVAKLFTDIVSNGYRIMYLTSRAIGQADTTRDYLRGIKQDGYSLPEGPVIMSPDRLIASLHREVILRKPEVFKMAALRDIARLFGNEAWTHESGTSGGDAQSPDPLSSPILSPLLPPGANSATMGDGQLSSPRLASRSLPPDLVSSPPLPPVASSPSLHPTLTGQATAAASPPGPDPNVRSTAPTPFFAGFGNRITDALSYRSVDIPSSRIFTIDPNGEVKMELLEMAGYNTSYIHMTDLVDQMFPVVLHKKSGGADLRAQRQFNDVNFWRAPLPDVILPDPEELKVPAVARKAPTKSGVKSSSPTAHAHPSQREVDRGNTPHSPALSARSGYSIKSVPSDTDTNATDHLRSPSSPSLSGRWSSRYGGGGVSLDPASHTQAESYARRSRFGLLSRIASGSVSNSSTPSTVGAGSGGLFGTTPDTGDEKFAPASPPRGLFTQRAQTAEPASPRSSSASLWTPPWRRSRPTSPPTPAAEPSSAPRATSPLGTTLVTDVLADEPLQESGSEMDDNVPRGQADDDVSDLDEEILRQPGGHRRMLSRDSVLSLGRNRQRRESARTRSGGPGAQREELRSSFSASFDDGYGAAHNAEQNAGHDEDREAHTSDHGASHDIAHVKERVGASQLRRVKDRTEQDEENQEEVREQEDQENGETLSEEETGSQDDDDPLLRQGEIRFDWHE